MRLSNLIWTLLFISSAMRMRQACKTLFNKKRPEETPAPPAPPEILLPQPTRTKKEPKLEYSNGNDDLVKRDAHLVKLKNNDEESYILWTQAEWLVDGKKNGKLKLKRLTRWNIVGVGENRHVRDILPHPKYDPEDKTNEYNFGLIRISKDDAIELEDVEYTPYDDKYAEFAEEWANKKESEWWYDVDWAD